MMAKRALALAGAIAAAASLAACQPRIANMDCDAIAREAQRIWTESPNQPIRVTAIRNPHEVSRNEHEARCTAEATWSDQSVGNINLRAFQSENGSVMVESGTQPFAGNGQ